MITHTPSRPLRENGGSEPDQPGLLSSIAGRARRTPTTILVAAAIGGILAFTAVATLVPASWPFALPFLSLAAIGVWGLLDRVRFRFQRESNEALHLALTALQFLAVVVGVCAALTTLYAITGRLIGTVVS